MSSCEPSRTLENSLTRKPTRFELASVRMGWFTRKTETQKRDLRSDKLAKAITKIGGFEVVDWKVTDHEERPGGSDRTVRVTAIKLVER